MRKREDKKQGAPGWLLTFGDLLTLLLTFFVLEISFASFTSNKMKEVISALRRGFGVLEAGGSSEIGKPKIELENPYFIKTYNMLKELPVNRKNVLYRSQKAEGLRYY